MLIKKFEEAVKQHASRIAVKVDTETVTYDGLNRRANQVASEIITQPGPGNGNKQAALLLEHGIGMTAAVIGTLKAGWVYIPIDRNYPENRIAYLLENAEADTVITNGKNLDLARRVAEACQRDVTIIDIDAIPKDTPGHNPERNISGDSNAYILYTSGSTGRPKGVIQTQANTYYYVRNWIQRFEITPRDRMTLVTSFTHDGFQQDIWAALLGGATLFPYDVKDVLAHAPLPQFVQQEKITIWHSVPTLYRYLADNLRPADTPPFPHLRFVLLGGEPLRNHDFEILEQFFPRARLANVYGQTESSVASICIYKAGDTFGFPVLGQPLDQTELLLVDDEGEVVEDIGSGEIVVACAHIAPGYWKDPETTEEKFDQDDDLGRFYWTGDLGSLRGDETITLMGRKDFQVKIRGFRVETGEIESVLKKHPGLNETAVVLKQTGDEEDEPYLRCYFTPGEPAASGEVLREYLLHQVPDYMVPQIFIQMEQFPLTSSGKIDRKALPEPDLEETEKIHTPPATETEKQLAAIWKELLFLHHEPPHPLCREDNFFQLGGHSLKAINLISTVHREFHVKLELEDIFSIPNLHALAAHIDGKGKERYLSVEPVEEQEHYPLSSAQERLYILHRMEPGSTGYNLDTNLRLKGPLKTERLEQAFRALIQRHEALRTSFVMIGDTPRQRVHRTVDFQLELHHLPPGGGGKEIRAVMEEFFHPFDLEQAPLMRAGLIRLDETDHILMSDMHHIISDGTSGGIMTADFTALYNGVPPAPLRVQYKDYSHWMRLESQQEALKQQEGYWLQRLAAPPAVLDLPLDFPRPPLQDFSGGHVESRLDARVTAQLKELALRAGTTLYTLLLSLFNVLLARLSSQEDILTGTPVAGRGHADLRPMIGMFVNTLVMRNFPQPGTPFLDVLTAAGKLHLADFGNQDYPFEMLVEKLDVNRDAARNPLFDCMFSFLDFDTPGAGSTEPARPVDEAPGTLTTEPFSFDTHTSAFDLSLIIMEEAGELRYKLEYASKIFRPGTIRRMVSYFARLAGEVCRRPQAPGADLEMLAEEEKQELPAFTSGPTSPAPGGAPVTLHQAFAQRAAQVPGRTAVTGPGEDGVRLTFETLDALSSRLAGELRRRGAVPGTIAGLMLPRSPEMVAGILGILKTGAAYLPIAPDTPAGRIRYILEDGAVTLLLTDEGTGAREDTDFPGCDIITIPPVTEEPVGARDEPGLPSPLPAGGPADPAYVIYTSGSTGRPKGVAVEHGSVINTLRALQEMYPLSGDDVYLLKTAFTFDVSVTELFGWFFGQGTLALLEQGGEADPAVICDAIRAARVTHVNFVPSLFIMFVDMLGPENTAHLSSLKYIFLAGEALPQGVVERFRALGTGITLENLYGPTEAAVYATRHPLEAWAPGVPVPIGKPFPNMKTHILDRYLRPCPIGVAGELYLSGPGLARGYLNNPETTAQHFFTPAGAGAEGPLYRTGDRVRWLPGGDIEFLGRTDHQVKISGLRIELEEIEVHLARHPRVHAAVVAPHTREQGHSFLVAYIVPAGAEPPAPEALKDHLSQFLPAYMVPGVFMFLEALPLAAHGKIDRKALPRPEAAAAAGGRVPPSKPRERIMLSTWAEVLGLPYEAFGMEDNFFQLGGNSLKATSLLARIKKRFNITIPLGELFRTPTPRGLALHLPEDADSKDTPAQQDIPTAPEQEYYPLSPAQKRLFLLQRMEEQSTAYNMPSLIPLPPNPDTEKLEQVFHLLIQRHESFRTSFHLIDDTPAQKIHDTVEFSITIVPQSGVQGARHGRDLLAPPGPPEGPPESPRRAAGGNAVHTLSLLPFDLSHPPLLRAAVLPSLPSPLSPLPSLFIDMHHIISDGLSMEILAREFETLYTGGTLPQPRLQYKDYACWMNRLETLDMLRDQGNFWLELYRDEIPVLDLPIDYPRPAIQSFEGKKYNFSIDTRDTSELKQLARESNCTLYMVLLAAFGAFLARITGQEEIVVGTPTAGRRHPELEPTTGMFVNTLPLRLPANGEKPFDAYLREVKSHTLEAFDNQDFPFEELVEAVDIAHDAGRNPLFDAMFSFQTAPPQTAAATDAPSSGQDEGAPDLESGVAKFDLTLEAVDAGQELYLILEYASKLFQPETIERFAHYFRALTASILQNPAQSMDALVILPEAEKRRLLIDFNDTAAPYEKNMTMYELFREQVEKHPHRTAVTGPTALSRSGAEITLSYGHLDVLARRLSRQLKKRGAKRDGIAALITSPCVEMLTAILAAWAAECAYLPIAPDTPQDRIDYMLNDSNASILLIGSSPQEQITAGTDRFVTCPNFAGRYMVSLPEFTLEAAARIGTGYKPVPTSAKELDSASLIPPTRRGARAVLAYVIYTSGTTGGPKGVMVEHTALMNHELWLQDAYNLSYTDIIMQKTAFTFDVSVCELTRWIPRGAKVYILPEKGETEPHTLARTIARQQVTTIDFVPPVMNLFLDYLQENRLLDYLSSLRLVIIGVEEVPLPLVRKFNRLLYQSFGTRLFNAYGPTEATIDMIMFPCSGGGDLERIPIGSPISNTRVYILDKHLNPQPTGVAGQLCIAGAQLARGYLNNPELTHQKFVFNPLVLEPDQLPQPGRGPTSLENTSPLSPLDTTLYLTGDRARRLPDGNIEFLGRLDRQVKIRGFRVEPQEIQQRLLSHPNLRDAAVAVRTGTRDEKYLCAYVVPASGENPPEPEELRRFLGLSLPDYMVPPYVVFLEKIPLTRNEKTDWKALPEPETAAKILFIPPRDSVEKSLVQLWAGVLDREPDGISIEDNFFRLGGHSLKATVLAGKIHKQWGVSIPLAELFKAPTIAGLAQFIRARAQQARYNPVEPAQPHERYPLSPAQKRLYILHRIDPESTAYNIPTLLETRGPLDRDRMEKAFRALIQRHESLRTSFHAVDGEPYQKVHQHEQVSFELETFEAAADESAAEDRVDRFLRPFDLTRAPLFRAGLVPLGEGRHLLMADVHHTVSDGVSMDILIVDFAALYDGRDLPPPALQYKDYAVWLDLPEQRNRLLAQEGFWLEQFEGEPETLHLPYDFPRPGVQRFEGRTVAFQLDESVFKKGKELVLKENATTFILVLSVLQVLLARLSGQGDITVGTPTAGRDRDEFQPIIGMFVNTLALRHYPEGEKTFNRFFREVKNRTLGAFDNQDYPFEALVDRLGLHRDPARNPLFDVMLVLETGGASAAETGAGATGLEIVPYRRDAARTSKFDLTLTATETPGGTGFTLEYCTQLFEESTARRFGDYFQRLFMGAVSSPALPMGRLDMISEGEQKQILEQFNDTAIDYPHQQTLHGLFHMQAQKTPDHIALVEPHSPESTGAGAIFLTYKELAALSQTIARELTAKGAAPGGIIAVSTERSTAMVIALLAILHTGCAYLPIAPDTPGERIDYILNDSNASIMLTDPHRPERITASTKSAEKAGEEAMSSWEVAYVIYTSGTTGKPKGVLIEHRNAVNTVTWFARTHELTHRSRVPQMTGFTFDASVNQIFGTLLHGASLYIVPQRLMAQPEEVRKYFLSQDICLINFTPYYIRELLANSPRIPCLERIISGGESLDRGLKDRLRQKGYRVFNQYGPTETTIDALAGECLEGSVTLGTPIANTVCLILDGGGSLCPAGIPGELVVTGSGIARGYLNRPQLTAERFVWLEGRGERGVGSGPSALNSGTEPPPRFSLPSRKHLSPLPSRFYHTGDRVRWRVDGTVEFIGRVDHQVKVRGYRIEPGEIESLILQFPGVRETVVMPRGVDGQTGLCAYVVSGEDPADLWKQLKEFLSLRLPAYMVPAYFVLLDRMPLTSTGKLNRRALPLPEAALESGQDTAPATPIEEQLMQVWQTVLGLETGRVRPSDDFFRLGGNSLASLRLVSEVYKVFNIDLPVVQVIRTPVLRDMALYLRRDRVDHAGDELAILLGGEQEQKIFAFPPAVGMGMSYMELSALLPGVAFYAFNYIHTMEDEQPGLMERYLETMLEKQPRGPYTLLGYSAGGRLCIKTAHMLEARGFQVADIILLDAYSQRKEPAPEEREKAVRDFNAGVEASLKTLGLEHRLQDTLTRIDQYGQYHDGLEDLEPVNADVHLIRARPQVGNSGYTGWETFTRGVYREYEGFGRHYDMLSPGEVEQNARLVGAVFARRRAGEYLTPEIRAVYRDLSPTGELFMDYLSGLPGAFDAASYREILETDHGYPLVSWPMFINPGVHRRYAGAALEVCRLIKSLPRRLFKSDPAEAARYLEIPLHLARTQMADLEDHFLSRLLSRGDFIVDREGIKCLEFNISSNLGGIQTHEWEGLYRKNSVVSGFLKQQGLTPSSAHLLPKLLTHLARPVVEARTGPGTGEVNIAFVFQGYPAGAGEDPTSAMMNRFYRQVLEVLPGSRGGGVIFCDYPHLETRGGRVYHRGREVSVLVEQCEGMVPPEFLEISRAGNLHLYNGPVSGILSNKLNLALLSGNAESPLFTDHEKEIIRKHIPWTRKVVHGETRFRGQTVLLETFLLESRELLVLKPSVGLGGEDVYIGKNTASSKWEELVGRALEQRNWLVQERVESLPYGFQCGESGVESYDLVWGLFFYGETYAGAANRVLPKSNESGIINAVQGALSTVLFEVEE